MFFLSLALLSFWNIIVCEYWQKLFLVASDLGVAECRHLRTL